MSLFGLATKLDWRAEAPTSRDDLIVAAMLILAEHDLMGITSGAPSDAYEPEAGALVALAARDELTGHTMSEVFADFFGADRWGSRRDPIALDLAVREINALTPRPSRFLWRVIDVD